MMEKFGYPNKMAVPSIEKVVVNIGFGRLGGQQKGEGVKKMTEAILRDLALITAQKPVVTKAKRSIAGFKIRQGQAVGAKVTLRRQKMTDFLERVIHIALPRSRDFQGLSLKCLDSKGHLTFGLKEHIVFPEIAPEKTDFIFGLEVTVVTTAKSREEAEELLRLLGFPFKK